MSPFTFETFPQELIDREVTHVDSLGLYEVFKISRVTPDGVVLIGGLNLEANDFDGYEFKVSFREFMKNCRLVDRTPLCVQ